MALLVACAPLDGASVAELADACAGCHVEEAEAHADSRHAGAAESEVFRALRARAGTTFCDSCHRQITCLDCHSAVGNEAVQNGRMLFDTGGPVRGPTGARSAAPHATRRSGYLLSSDLCGTCHQVAGPAGFRETPFTHWMSSPAAARNLGCRDCHRTHRRSVDLDAGAHIAVAGGALTIDHSEGGHHFPDGASFLRDFDVVLRREGAEVARFSLGAELFLGETPVVLPTDADRVVLRGIEAGTSRTEVVPEADQACLEVRRYRLESSRVPGAGSGARRGAVAL